MLHPGEKRLETEELKTSQEILVVVQRISDGDDEGTVGQHLKTLSVCEFMFYFELVETKVFVLCSMGF